jgi:Holliday junction resolvase RusA-like endonuclease
MMHGTNRPPFTADDIQDVSGPSWPRHTQCACNPGCMSCAPSCRSSGPDRPFGLPADSIEITLDLPMPTSVNQNWRSGRGRVYRSKAYLQWIEQADIAVMAAKQYPKRKIVGPFEIQLLLSETAAGLSDGDNRIKAALDWLQSRDVVRNDSDCRRGSWAWVEPSMAPKGCRVILRSLHG